MPGLKFHFLLTGEQPSMLVEHPNRAVLFDVPGDSLPVEPDALFLTQRGDEVVKKAQEFAETFDIPVMGAGQLSVEGFEVEPFQAAKRVKGKEYCKAYGYMIKSRGINIGYVPFATEFPRELLGADIVVLSGENSNRTVAMAKSAGITRIYLTGLTDEMRKAYLPKGVTKLSDGQVLTLTGKTAQAHKEDAEYLESQGEVEGDCGACRFFTKSAKEEFSKPVDVKPNEIRVRVRPVSDFQADSFRTISISAQRGIRAVIGRPRGQTTTRVQSYRFDKSKWDAGRAADWVRSHGETVKSTVGACGRVQGDISSDFICGLFEPTTLAPLTSAFAKSTQQAFGSPGGKRAIAKKIVSLIPEHTTFVEPYAGGAAVFFAKDRSEREVLNDLDVGIAQAYKDLQSLSDADVRKIQRLDWTISKARFERLKKSTATGKVGRLYKFLYMRGSAYGNYTQPSASHEGKIMKVASRLPQIRERLQKVAVTNQDALEIIRKFDSTEAFFYLDPPYPTEWKWDEGGHGGRAGSDEWSGKDLHRLFEVLKSVKGKFILSLEGEIAKIVPKDFTVTKIAVPRQMALGPTGKLGADPEILVSNYDVGSVEKSQPDVSDLHVDRPLSRVKTEKDGESELLVIAKSDDEKRLVWTVNMVPNAVDGEGHWQTPDTILQTAHNFMLKDIPVWSEHQKRAAGVFPVQSFVLPFDWDFTDFQGSERSLPMGTWVTVLWVQNDEEWAKVKSGEYVGTSVRGFARKRERGPPPAKRTEAGEA